MPAGGDDGGVVNLAERAKVRQDCQTLWSIQNGFHARWQRSVRVRHSLGSNALEIKARFRRRTVLQMEYRQIIDTLRRRWDIWHRFELLIFDALREVRIRH